jgi:predicted NAD/FAD-dependent oxidoreductase
MSPDAADYLTLFSQYRADSGTQDFGAAYLEPADERYRLLFEQVCRLLVKSSDFNRAMPQEFRNTARLYLRGDRHTLKHMAQADMRHFMLSDLYDYVHLCQRAGQQAW